MQIHKNALVQYSPAQMFRLVDDIVAYPEFLPWCRDASEIHRQPGSVEARLDIAYSGFHKSFTTRNQLTENQRIEMELVEGPFKYLKGTWRFDALGEAGCKVSLDMDFEFSSKLVGMTFGSLFSKIASSLVDAFTQRAKQVYG